MDFNLKLGMAASIEETVSESDTAVNFGSGGVRVLATPRMVALMEKAALTAVDRYLENGFATVGTTLNVKHTAATPIGMKIKATAELMGMEGKKLIFCIEAFDEVEKIGEGIHERYIIELNKFMDKTNNKHK